MFDLGSQSSIDINSLLVRWRLVFFGLSVELRTESADRHALKNLLRYLPGVVQHGLSSLVEWIEQLKTLYF